MARPAASRKASRDVVEEVRRLFRRWRRLYELVREEPRRPPLASAGAVAHSDEVQDVLRADAPDVFPVVRPHRQTHAIAAAVQALLRTTARAAPTIELGLASLPTLYLLPRSNPSFRGQSASHAAWQAVSAAARTIRSAIAVRNRHEASSESEHAAAWAETRRRKNLVRDRKRRAEVVPDVVERLRRQFDRISRAEVGSLEVQLEWEKAQIATPAGSTADARTGGAEAEVDAASRLAETADHLRRMLVPSEWSRTDLHGTGFGAKVRRWSDEPARLRSQLSLSLSRRNEGLGRTFAFATEWLRDGDGSPSPSHTWTVIRAYELIHDAHTCSAALVLIRDATAIAATLDPNRSSLPGAADLLAFAQQWFDVSDRLEREYEHFSREARGFRLVVEVMALFVPNGAGSQLAQLDAALADVRRSIERARSKARAEAAFGFAASGGVEGASTSARALPAFPSMPAGPLSAKDWAGLFRLDSETVRARFNRWRKQNPMHAGCTIVTEGGPRQARRLYSREIATMLLAPK